ncbi:MAG TPA: FemAB family XrtA/PEP-CTERM system-associated protein [Gemmatimonadales bacterium]|nr:FemAB family XrtA/PEP-CTERM system-associated protein [Gemmatimonadales bacterium]
MTSAVPGLGRGAGVAVASLGTDRMAEWDAYVLARPEGEIFHTTGWLRVVRDTYGHRVHRLAAVEGDTIRGVLPLAHIRSRLFGDCLASAPYGTSGGILADSDRIGTILALAAVDLARALGVGYLELKHHRPTPDLALVRVAEYLTYRLPLADPDTLWRERLEGRGRRAVAKARRAGLRAAWDGDGLDILYRLVAGNMRRLGTPVHARAFFENILRVFGDAAEIVVVRDGREPVAALLQLRFGRRTVLYTGADRHDRRALNGFSFCVWEAIRRAAGRGDAMVDFGRSPVGAGTALFKQQWGARATPLCYEYALLGRRTPPRYNVNNPRLAPARAAWRRLPPALTLALGPRLIRSIP